MKQVLILSLLSILLLTSCKKDEFEYTGLLEITFKLSDTKDFSSISVYIYSIENLSYSLFNEKPDKNGVIKKELLPGNYRASVYYHGNEANPTFQIINGKKTSFDFQFK